MCIFCQIVNKEIPAKIIYEDQNVLAILDISQATKGHFLVMPKEHYVNLLEVPEKLSAQLMEVTKTLAVQVVDRLQALGCNILTNINEAAGQTVFHCHIHVLPRYPEDDLTIKFTTHQEDLDQVLHQITNS